eukprot:GDKK01065194.1.p1 GENE.GDKK01065194.1~~GDKK01065194.1.p1  ORF type:complete len:256 (-),score=67.43 GDKK01065194.1:1234-2001(-)
MQAFFPILISTIRAYEAEVKKEAVWACANIATNGSSQQISFLVECHVLDALCDVLTASVDVKILTVALEALLTILECGAEHMRLGHYQSNTYADHIRSFQGDMSIEPLMAHSNSEIRNLVQEIMVAYFDSDVLPVDAPQQNYNNFDNQQQNGNTNDFNNNNNNNNNRRNNNNNNNNNDDSAQQNNRTTSQPTATPTPVQQIPSVYNYQYGFQGVPQHGYPTGYGFNPYYSGHTGPLYYPTTQHTQQTQNWNNAAQ